jgi:hypothetical protein
MVTAKIARWAAIAWYGGTLCFSSALGFNIGAVIALFYGDYAQCSVATLAAVGFSAAGLAANCALYALLAYASRKPPTPPTPGPEHDGQPPA